MTIKKKGSTDSSAHINARIHLARWDLLFLFSKLLFIFYSGRISRDGALDTQMEGLNRNTIWFFDQRVISRKLVNEFAARLSADEFRGGHFLRRTISIPYASLEGCILRHVTIRRVNHTNEFLSTLWIPWPTGAGVMKLPLMLARHECAVWMITGGIDGDIRKKYNCL